MVVYGGATSLHLYAPPYCVYVWQNCEQWQNFGLGGKEKLFRSSVRSMLVLTIFCASLQPSWGCQTLNVASLVFLGDVKVLTEKKIVNSLSPSSPSTSSSLRAIYDVIMHFIPGEIPSPTAGTELIKFCFSFFSFFNLHRQKRNRMEIYPVVRAKIPTPTRPLTPTMIRRDWGSKGSCNAIVLRSPMIKSTAWRKSLSGLTIQSKKCDDFFWFLEDS